MVVWPPRSEYVCTKNRNEWSMSDVVLTGAEGTAVH